VWYGDGQQLQLTAFAPALSLVCIWKTKSMLSAWSDSYLQLHAPEQVFCTSLDGRRPANLQTALGMFSYVCTWAQDERPADLPYGTAKCASE
jgi:hypothetical protein